MHEPHPIFLEPTDNNVKIWRYIDFAKLMSLVDRKSLFFVKASKLFDPFEGSLPKFNVQRENREFIYSERRHKFPTEEGFLKFIKSYPQLVAGFRRLKPITLINSWHMSEYESAAMWDLYSQRDASVAIQSTFKRLSECFKENTSDTVWIGKVNYMDYEKEWMSEGNVYEAFLIKRKPFEHERELRAVISLPWEVGGLGEPVLGADKIHEERIDPHQMTESGKYVPVNLEILVEKVYISPLAQPWFSELVQSLLQRFSIASNRIIKSDLFDLS